MSTTEFKSKTAVNVRIRKQAAKFFSFFSISQTLPLSFLDIVLRNFTDPSNSNDEDNKNNLIIIR